MYLPIELPPRSSFALGTRSYELGNGSLLSNTFRHLLYLSFNLSIFYLCRSTAYTYFYTTNITTAFCILNVPRQGTIELPILSLERERELVYNNRDSKHCPLSTTTIITLPYLNFL